MLLRQRSIPPTEFNQVKLGSHYTTQVLDFLRTAPALNQGETPVDEDGRRLIVPGNNFYLALAGLGLPVESRSDDAHARGLRAYATRLMLQDTWRPYVNKSEHVALLRRAIPVAVGHYLLTSAVSSLQRADLAQGRAGTSKERGGDTALIEAAAPFQGIDPDRIDRVNGYLVQEAQIFHEVLDGMHAFGIDTSFRRSTAWEPPQLER